MTNRRGFLKAVSACFVLPLAPVKWIDPNITVPLHWNRWSPPRISSEYATIQMLLENGIIAHDNLIEAAIFKSQEGGQDGNVPVC